jgi:hypothetical protein
MNIRNATDNQFAELMGDATDDEAHVMREMLTELGFEDTNDVPDPIWRNLLIAAIEASYR